MGCLHSLEVTSYEILINYKGKMNNLHWWVFLVSPGNITTNGTDRNYVPPGKCSEKSTAALL